MSWTDNYWDIVNEFYWVPSYLGLKSIPQKHWVVGEEFVTIPKEMTNPSGPLYRRLRSSEEYWTYIRRQEETFNHIFNLTLSILPGDVISQLVGPFFGHAQVHEYQLSDNSIRDLYPWINGGNVTTPDSFLISDNSVLAVEIKFNAKTSLDQLGKYVALIAGEEIYGARHDDLNLLYIYPARASEKFLKETTINPDEFGVKHFSLLEKAVKNSHVQALYSAEPNAIVDVLSRLRISCITWEALLEALGSYTNKCGDSQGDRTLRRLLEGLASEIRRHPLSGVRHADTTHLTDQ